jgi:hypothetical protein
MSDEFLPSSAIDPAPGVPISGTPAPSPRADGGAAAFQEVSADELAAEVAVQPWLWHGLLAPGNVTLLTSQWKSGKTTLMAVLLARLRAGGDFAGRPLRAGRAVVVSEEGKRLWGARQQRLGFGDHIRFLLRPFLGKPSFEQWLQLIEHLIGLRQRDGTDLVVIDPLAAFLPGHAETNAALMMEALLPLRELTNRDVAVNLLHHPRKGDVRAGQAARGSGALPAFADILVELTHCGVYDPADRRRLLRCFARHDETPARWVIELNAAGTDYTSHGDRAEDDFAPHWEQLRAVLEDADRKLTCLQLLRAWPEDGDPPVERTLRRWLAAGVARGLVSRDGTGRKGEAYRYWLPGHEKRFFPDARDFLGPLPNPWQK